MDKTSSKAREFLHYELKSDMLSLGERERGTIFRPCIDVFTYTALAGALKARFPHPDRKIHAVGHFRHFKKSILTLAPRDRGREVSSIPIQAEYLYDVEADVYVFQNDFTVKWPDEFTIHIGALKSKGLGHCNLRKIGTVPANVESSYGVLNVRIPFNPEFKDEICDIFGIEEDSISPVYGYLFKPERGGTGHYVLSLFEGSKMKANQIIIKS